ncbi:hypothetical protein GCM10011491_30500 [Brucella endophytica]|uniref:Uncharacterized protein n=1 Tax=Brucella endophytica TaxID=1963359 RepID=A0A916SHA6_9HYPH|nr:hypothetical protein [Brucella endophytica]GGB00142.1 hypothetical protein GCM10011491_30500 [Brucella endophytica]
MNNGPPLFYALESLPELIGERQFKMLCEALDIDEKIFLFKEYKQLGYSREEYFARYIQSRANSTLERRKRINSVPSAFEGML